jgi:lysophospholipase L1-like esterase
MKSVLIYGDSLVYGKLPKSAKRYKRPKNFVGILEKALGDEYEVVAEGLRARTLSGENEFFPFRNGLTQFGPILGSHLPLDLVCIMLGTNDCNAKSVKSEEEFYTALSQYKNEIDAWCKTLSIEQTPKLMIISPPAIRDDQAVLDELMKSIFTTGSEEKSKKLKDIYKKFCEQENCIFFDAAEYCKTAESEGIHLDEDNNVLLGKALAEKIVTVFES